MLVVHEQSPFLMPKLLSSIALLSKDQPQKYLQIHFSPEGLSLSTLDSSQQISIGVSIPGHHFSAYICEKKGSFFILLQRLSKALSIAQVDSDTITLSYESSQANTLSARIYSLSTVC